MPVTCIVVGCGNRSNRKHRVLWVGAIKRDDLTDSKIRNQRVCSQHFIAGKHALLEVESHPDWVPSQNMGYRSQKVLKRPDDIARKERVEKRRKFQISEVKRLMVIREVQNAGPDQNHDVEDYVERNTGISIQTQLTMEELQLHLLEIEETRQIAHLRIHVERVIGLIKNKFDIFKGTHYSNKYAKNK